jgi:hypothetical protein
LSIPPSVFFTYTPIPWTIILLIFLYKNDLSQLLHPVKEKDSIHDWRSALRKLGLYFQADRKLGNSKPRPAPSSRFIVHIRERYPNTMFYSLMGIVVTSSSLLSSLLLAPMLVKISPGFRFEELLLVFLQLFSALPCVLVVRRFFGPFPGAPFKFHLKKLRRGSLLKYVSSLFKT